MFVYIAQKKLQNGLRTPVAFLVAFLVLTLATVCICVLFVLFSYFKGLRFKPLYSTAFSWSGA